MLRGPWISLALGGLVWGGCSFQPASQGPGGDAPRADAAVDAEPDAPPDAYVPRRHRRIEIDPAKVTGTQPEFPVWFTLTDADLQARALATGEDIHFTELDGTPLSYEIQRWDPATGRLDAWVKLDLDDVAVTAFELRYGDAAAAHPPAPTSVFTSSFAAVWHLDDALAATTVADSTGARDGTAAGGLGPTDQVAGKLGGSVDFDGVDDEIQFTNPYKNNDKHTISAWIDQRTASGFDSIVTVGTASPNQSRWFHSHYTPNIAVGFYGNDWSDTGRTVDAAGWRLLHWVYEAGGNRRSRLYIDGAQVATFDHGGGIGTQGNGGHIGSAPVEWGPGGNTLCALNGKLDEVRLATVARSAEWIATEFANQSAPETFYSVGPDEPLP